MKNVILSLVLCAAFLSCSEDEPQPVDKFSGSWYLAAPEVPVEIGFDVVRSGSIYNYDATVIHSAIPTDQQANNNMICYDKFENGYGRIEITSRGEVYYKITLIYNRFTEEGMSTYDVQIDIPGQPFVVLTDRVFTKQGL